KSESALITTEDSLLKQYVDYKYPHTKSFSRKAASQDDTILNDGMKVGEKLVIYKGITEKSNSSRRLPG
ncbi:MAG: hypothetical protein ISS65_13675, partial [Desulfobacterales bacterium]|nr:hypothetical protein [Desulfobacterales bacterium]